MVNRYKDNSKIKEERGITELDSGVMPQILCKEYLAIYEGIQSEIVNTTTFDKNSDLSTTYLGKSDKTRNNTKSGRVIPHFRTWVYIRQTIRWNRMSLAVGHRCE